MTRSGTDRAAARDALIRRQEAQAYAHYDLAPTVRTVPVDTTFGTVDVRLTTFGEPGAEPPVLLLHGIASVNVIAAPLLPFLGDRYVVAVDWPGHGLSGRAVVPRDADLRRHAVSVIRSVLNALDLPQVDVVGHSLGAQFAMYAAADLGDRVRRLVLLGAPGAGFLGVRPIPIMRALSVPGLGASLLAVPTSKKMFRRNNEQSLGKGALDGLPDDLLEAGRGMSRRTGFPASVSSFFRALIRRGTVRSGVAMPLDDLSALTQPVLLVWGDDDVFMRPEAARESIDAIKDSELVRVPAAGHAPWLQDLDRVGNAVAAHLTRERSDRRLDGPIPYATRRSVCMSTEPTRVDVESDGGTTIATYEWRPEGAPRAIAQIVHGVGEYALRYQPLVDDLLAAGYVVYSHDHRGHGNTAKSESDFGVLGETGWDQLVLDIGRVGDLAKDRNPGLPLALIAHSLGSFATQQYLLDHSDDVTVVALTGTAVIDLLEPAMDLDAPMDLSAFNAPFQPPRTDFDWLSRDDAQVDKYIADPWCGFGLDVPGGRAMFAAARQLADPARVAQMRSDLPVYIAVGELDPVNGGGALVDALVARYEAAGLTDVTLRVWPGARHEVFNETDRDDVVGELMQWLASRLPD